MRTPSPVVFLVSLALAGCIQEQANTSDGPLADVGPAADTGAADSGPAQRCELIELDACFRGSTFADCGGDGPPAVFCDDLSDPSTGRCLWFEGGCPAVGYPDACPEPDVTDGLRVPSCPISSASVGWGAAPWTRDRAQNLSLRIDPTLEPAQLALNCGPCAPVEGVPAPPGWLDGQCLSRSSVCDERETFLLSRGNSDWPLPGLVSISIYEPDQLGGHYVHIELDFERQGARICVVESTDTPTAPGQPICAISGSITVNKAVSQTGEIAEMFGQFRAEFPPFSVFSEWAPYVSGLEIEGRF